nr:PREDICTED: uncharacterized protein LOC109043311 [Bemisia tabaci]
MAVVPKDYPKSRLSEKEMELVQQALLARIEPDSETKPQFQGTKFEQGALMLYCRDLVTKIWLQDKTATLVPWEGAELKAVLAKDLIVSCRVIFEAPAELKKAKPSEILEKIEGQNGGLLTKDWKVIHSKETTIKMEEANKEWQNAEGMRHSKQMLEGYSRKMTANLLHRSREQLGILSGLLTGHNLLRKHMHRMGIFKDEPKCRLCEVEEETAEHIIFDCEALEKKRQDIRGDNPWDDCLAPELVAGTLLQLVEGEGFWD